MSASSVNKRNTNAHPAGSASPREGSASPKQDSSRPAIAHRSLDSHSLYWNDLNKPKFLSLITGFYLGLRLVIYPITVVSSSREQNRSSCSIRHWCGTC
jgi:hypothetical protein